jgi:type I restriction enzyme S subunit
MEAKALRYNTYPAYKDSGVEWLEMIPEKWEIRRIKYLFTEINTRSLDGNADLLSVSQYTGVTKKTDKLDEGVLLTNASTLEGYKKVKAGDLVSNIMLAWNGSLGFSPFEGITSPAYSVYRLNSRFEKRYFHYLLRTELYKAEFKRKSTGVIESRLRLYTDDFFRIWSFLPPIQEQTAIAKFLDNKTAKIDQSIAQKEKLIERLKERKQILIQNAVTGKVVWNKEENAWTEPVEVKDSGVEWIGEIPEGWEVKKMSLLTNKIGDGLHGTPEYTDNTEYFFINGNNLSKGYIEITDQTKTVCERQYLINRKTLTKQTLLLSINGTIGNVAFYKGEKVMLGKSAAYLNFKDNVNIEFIRMYLVSGVFKNYYELELSGSTINNLSLYSINKTPIVYPSQKEQLQIVTYIQTQSTKIDRAIALQQTQIEKLKEFKSTLIDSAVTGKIKV